MIEKSANPVQFRLRHLLLFMSAAAAVLAVSRWILTRRAATGDLLPLFIWASLAISLLTVMGWILLGAGRRWEASWLRAISLLLSVAPVGWWIACLLSIPAKGGDALPIAELFVTAGAIGSAICLPLQSLAVAANLWRTTDRLLLVMQVTAVVLTCTCAHMTWTLWAFR